MPVPSSTSTPVPGIAPTSIHGLDDVLAGGLTRKRLYLVEGMPGSGKTTLALQFLRSAAARGEPVLYVTLSETEEELRAVAASHGWTLDGVTIHELMPAERLARPGASSTRCSTPPRWSSATTIKRDPARTSIASSPRCVVFDSLSELRLLAGSPLRYRRQILALKQFFASRELHGAAARRHDRDRPRPADAEHRARRDPRWSSCIPTTASERRRLRVIKYRGTRLPRRLPRLRHRARRPRASSRAWSPPSIGASATAGTGWPAACPSWTRCSAAASKRARAR